MKDPLTECFFRAYRRGYEAKPDAKNPYHRGIKGDLRGSHWGRFWQEGHQDATAKKPYRYYLVKRQRRGR